MRFATKMSAALPILAQKKIRSWVLSELTKIIGFADNTIVDYVLKLDNSDALQDYLLAFFPKKEQARKFSRQLASMRAKALAAEQEKNDTRQEVQKEKTTTPSQNDKAPSLAGVVAKRRPRPSGGRGRGRGRGNGRGGSKRAEPSVTVYRSEKDKKKALRKKQKELAKAAQKHDYYTCSCNELYGNCLVCGKIICKNEGTKYCSFCHTPLENKSKNAVNEKREKLEAEAAACRAEGIPVSAEWKAWQRKERLLEWDRSQAARSQVYDDQNDYFGDSQSAWMSFEEKEKAKRKLQRKEEKRAHRRRVRKYTVDLHGQRVVEESSSSSDYSSDEEPSPNAINANADLKNDPFFKVGSGPMPDVVEESKGSRNESAEFYANTTLKGRAREIYKLLKKQKKQGLLGAPPPLPSAARIEDDTSKANKRRNKRSALQHADDAGPMIIDDASNVNERLPHARRLWKSSERCLVVDQPFASLLIAGFRRFEGRSWSATYRGPLWIASSRKTPTKDSIALAEGTYGTMIDESVRPPFPSSYPTGCLLGRVELEDCLTAEEYRSRVFDATSQFENRSPHLLMYVRRSFRASGARLEEPC